MNEIVFFLAISEKVLYNGNTFLNLFLKGVSKEGLLLWPLPWWQNPRAKWREENT